MWTKRIHYLTEVNELSDYLKKVNNFTDCIISSFSFCINRIQGVVIYESLNKSQRESVLNIFLEETEL